MNDDIYRFIKKIQDAKTFLSELESYFEGKIHAAQVSNDFDFDFENNTYIIPDGTDPDLFIDYIESIKSKSAEEGVTMPALKEGTIYKRKDGIWLGKYYDNGVRKSVYASTKLDIINKVNEAVKERDRRDSESIANKKMTLSAWVNEWLAIYKKPKLRESSYKILTFLTNKIEKSNIGSKKVNHITPIDVEKFLNTIDKITAKYKTYTVLNEMMNDLMLNHVITENPCTFIKKPSPNPTTEKTVMTTDEFRVFFDRLKERSPKYYLFATFLVNTGLRKGEALVLTWQDIDFTNNLIKISKSFDITTKTISKTKTYKSNRIIPLFEGALFVLKTIGIQTSGEIFDIGKQAATNRFRMACHDIGYPNMNLHALRHIFASRCMEAGIDGKVVQKWLGHAKYDMTINTYTHVSSDFEKSEIEKINEIWRKNDGNY